MFVGALEAFVSLELLEGIYFLGCVFELVAKGVRNLLQIGHAD